MPYVFKGKKNATRDKVRGGYYTPRAIAEYLCSWAMRDGGERILEPSCGDGGFLEAVVERAKQIKSLQRVEVVGVELDPEEAKKAQAKFRDVPSNVTVDIQTADFFHAYPSLKTKRFNVAVGNPPFIRFQYFEEESRALAFRHLNEAGYHPTKLANCWVAFVELSIELLEKGGRLAMVLPAELLQVKYAEELRSRLAKVFGHIVLVTFRKLVFADIQQEVVLLLAEGKRDHATAACDVHTVELDDETQLTPRYLTNLIAHSETKHTHANFKWTALFLKDREFEIIKAAKANPTVKTLGDFVSVDVGIVTGRNDFFCVSKNTHEKFDLAPFVTPIVGKTSALKSIEFKRSDYTHYTGVNGAYLLNLKEVPLSKFNEGLKVYISHGEAAEVHEGYKCRIRKRWYDVPSVNIPDGFLFRQIHEYPLLVANTAKAACTDTIHRFVKRGKFPTLHLCASFVNSLTFCMSELVGRSYGGGVLELEPSEAEHLKFPFDAKVEIDSKYVYDRVAEDKIEQALDYVDTLLLKDVHGFSNADIAAFRRAWKLLRDRRINRK
jgi:adenine-specific DNA-methyltransferase